MFIEVMYSQERGFYGVDLPFPTWEVEEEREDYLKKLGCIDHGGSGGVNFRMHVAKGQIWEYVFEINDSIQGVIAIVFVTTKGDALSLRLKLMSGLTMADRLEALHKDVVSLKESVREGLFDRRELPYLNR